MMKRHSIGFWFAAVVAGLTVPMAAFGLDASYDTSQSSRFKISGVAGSTVVTSGTCTFNGGGTFDLSGGSHDFTGTYALSSNGKQIVLTIDTNGLAAIEAMLTSWTGLLAAENGVQISNVSLNLQAVTLSKASISKKTNKPNKVTISVRGKVSATVDGKDETKGFTYKCVVSFP